MSHDSAAFEQQLSALLDGRLNAEEAREVQEHLETCDECRMQYEAMASARRLLRATPAPSVPEGLLASIQREVRAEMARSAGPGIWERWRAPVAGLAAAAAVLLAVFAPWQALQHEKQAAVCPLPDDSAMMAESPAVETDDAEGEAVSAESAQSAAEIAEGVEADVNTAPVAAGARPHSRAVRTVSPAHGAPESELAAATPEEETPAAASPAPQPALASAPPSEQASGASAGPMLSDMDRATVIALSPRTTIESEPTLAPAGPSELESEMATGVVAGMVLDQFVAEHMVESSATLLSVVTDTPTSELGPVLVDEETEAGSFGFSFTDAMRRALTESENQVP